MIGFPMLGHVHVQMDVVQSKTIENQVDTLQYSLKYGALLMYETNIGDENLEGHTVFLQRLYPENTLGSKNKSTPGKGSNRERTGKQNQIQNTRCNQI